MSCPVATDRHYRGGCRETECRAAHADEARLRWRRNHNRALLTGREQKVHKFGQPIFCGVCRLEVEGCDGRYGDWMHTATHREIAADGHQARPETASDIGARTSARKQTA